MTSEILRDFQELTFHALRHTFAGILIDQGENIKYIKSQFGHAKAHTSIDIYSHLMKKENSEAARKRENLIFADLATGFLENDSNRRWRE